MRNGGAAKGVHSTAHADSPLGPTYRPFEPRTGAARCLDLLVIVAALAVTAGAGALMIEYLARGGVAGTP